MLISTSEVHHDVKFPLTDSLPGFWPYDRTAAAIASASARAGTQMDRSHFYATMNGEGTLDYELYLNTKALLSCQKDFKEFCNPDELQFQVVHQVEEMWMKLIAYTLLDI